MSRFDAIAVGLIALEDVQRRLAELDRDFGRALGQPLAGAEVERHAGPAPAVELQPQRDVGFGRRRRADAFFLAIARHFGAADPPGRVLRADDAVARVPFRAIGWIDASTSCLRSRTFSAENAIGGSIAIMREHLHQMVLDHVAQRAGPFVVARAALDADGLGRGDLHVIDVAPVPDRLEHAVREAEDQQVLDGFLAEVVIDAEDLRLVQVRVQQPVQLARARRDRCRTASRR